MLIKILLSIIIILVIAAAVSIFFMSRGLDTGSKLEVSAVNLSSIADGTYDGKYNNGRWTNEMRVTVKDHKITKIDAIKDVAFPKPEWKQEVFNRVIEKQNTDVDVVSGATVTSKAYLKAIENALK